MKKLSFMPVLKKYADSNDKSGYYVHAPVSGASYPIPLQTPEVTEEIYRELGYQPNTQGPDGGMNVPNELTWILYNVGLHWTEKSGPQSKSSDLDPDQFRKKSGPELTDDDIKTILSHVDDHTGQYQSRIKRLQTELLEKSMTSVGGSSGSVKYQFTDEVEEKLDQWEPNNIVDDDNNHDEGVFGYFTTLRSKHLELLASVPNLKQRLQEYGDHSWKVDYVLGEKTNTDDDISALKICFDTDSHSKLKKWTITDYRGAAGEHDFEIFIGVDTRRFRFEISDDYISDFSTHVGHQPTKKFDLPPQDFWGYEIESQDPNEIMHVLISEFSHIVSILSEFFDKFPSYTLDSMEMDDHSVDLP